MPRQHHDPALARLVGSNARRARHARALQDVAEGAYISTTMLSKVEHGHALPSVTVLLRLAASLGVGVETLFAEAA